jgi:multidrug efflux pump subunit AcrB
MNFRTIKVETGGKREHRVPDTLQTTRAITLAIRQVQGSHIADFGRDVEEALANLKGVLPDDLQVERTSNEPGEVEEKVQQFGQCLLEAVAIVIIVALLFMEWRSAVLVAFSIPLTVAMTMGMCQLVGIDLQQVSIAALIIALGLLVDDPVVAADAINRELADGQKPDVAAWLGPQKLARAILYATLTNCVAFLPLLLIKGASGDFIYSLPIVVTASLVASRIVSMTFMPLLGYYFLKGQRGFEAATGQGARAKFAKWFTEFTYWSLDHKKVILGACVGVLILCVAIEKLFIKTSFFPKDLHSVFTVNVYMPEGSPIHQTRDQAFQIIKAIDRLEGERIRSYTTFVGAGGPRFWLSIVPEQEAESYAQILVHTKDKEETAEIVERLKSSLPPLVAAPRVTIEQLETGPPIGVPVQLRIFGADIEQLRKLAKEVKDCLKRIPGSDNIHDDWDAEVLQISLNVKPDRANIMRISNQDVASTVATGLSGYSVTQLRERDHLIEVMLRLRSDERSQVSDLYGINVASSQYDTRVPLLQIGDIKTELVSPKVLRRDHERCLTVLCDAVPGVLPSEIVEKLEEMLPSLNWPPGYRYEFAGEYKEQSKGFADVQTALIVSLLSIYLALVLQFNNVFKPLIVFAAVPFGMVGGILGLLPGGAPFGFMAFLGVASLAGVIVSHIIVLFEFVEEMREKGEPLHQALADATLVRLRPVLVTVLATVGGLIPLAMEGGPLWWPLCCVQIAGLLIATVVTKVIVPAIYVVFVENLKLIKWEQEPEPVK